MPLRPLTQGERMLRKAISNQLEHILQTTDDLEKKRAKDYGHQVALTLDEKAGYNNVTNSIMHYEGRAKEARSILRMIDDLEVTVGTSKCMHCGHHEVGYRENTWNEFTALKPGERIIVRNIR